MAKSFDFNVFIKKNEKQTLSLRDFCVCFSLIYNIFSNYGFLPRLARYSVGVTP